MTISRIWRAFGLQSSHTDTVARTARAPIPPRISSGLFALRELALWSNLKDGGRPSFIGGAAGWVAYGVAFGDATSSTDEPQFVENF
jgi:hypothetical protein